MSGVPEATGSAECEAECAVVVRAATRGTGPEMRLVAAAASNGEVIALDVQGRHVEAEALVRKALARASTAPDLATSVPDRPAPDRGPSTG